MVERSCPQAFLDAYETHLETDASSEQFPDVELHPDAEHVFKPEGLAEVVRAGCVVRIERTSPSGDVMMQVVGVTSGGHMTSVLDILHEAGWVQPFPEVEPWVWESAPRDAGATEIHSVGVLPLDEDHFPRFDGWTEFFDSEEVILIGSLLP